jgi:hypothetical protein
MPKPFRLPLLFASAIVAILVPTSARAATQTFDYTGAEQDFVVPAGVTSITITASGAQGGTGGSSHSEVAGAGGTTTGTIAVTPGETLAVYVGRAGGNGVLSRDFSGAAGGAGGFNGGATGGSSGIGGGGGGGGSSDVRQGGNALGNRVIIAGGGGGSGANGNSGVGGVGGGSSGGDGATARSTGGSGGTPSAGGAGGAPNGGSGTAGSAGSSLDGGSGGTDFGAGGGGGGGGYFGGGGAGGSLSGDSGGGGGGSSFAIGTATNVSMTQGDHTGNGQVVLTWHSPAITVSNDAELRAALLDQQDGDTITFGADITLAGDLPAVQKSITIDGAGHALDGAGTYRGFFVANFNGGSTLAPVTVAIQNLTIRHAKAKGGDGGSGFYGGGGGAGMGGALFVADAANVTLLNVNFDSNNATGGAAVVFGAGAGGGGGLGGNGGHGGGSGTPILPGFTLIGSGGGGVGGNGGDAGFQGSDGFLIGASSGGAGGGGLSGGANGGGGGSGTTTQGAGGGGVAGAAGSSIANIGGSGGFGGGGGGGDTGGSGGFGGGGGGGSTAGGAGGFGGGGGAGGGLGGFGAGNGNLGGGGDGAALGGGIFVQQGGTLLINGSSLTSGGTVTPGGDIVGTNAHGYGNGIFIQGDNTLTFSPASGDAQILNDQIADQTGNGGTGGNAGVGSVTMNGAGTLVVSGANTYTGTTTISAGIFALVNITGSATGTGPVNVQTGAMLSGRGAASGTVNLLGGTLAPDSDQRLALGALLWHGGATVAASVGGSATVPVQIAGALGKGSPGVYTLALTDAGVTPGQTYTLITFGSNAGFTASDFTVTGVAGTVSLTGTELRFTTVALPPVYAVALDAAKGNERATFTLTNTGDTATSFRLARLARITGGGEPEPTPPKPGKPRIEFVYLLNGANITSAIEKGRATATLAPGATAQIVVKVKTHGAHRQRTIRVRLSATSVADPSVSATAKVSFVLKANR